jgi:hypothetical protein
VSVFPPPSLLGIGSEYTFPRQRMHETKENRRIRRFLVCPHGMKVECVGPSVYLIADGDMTSRYAAQFVNTLNEQSRTAKSCACRPYG